MSKAGNMTVPQVRVSGPGAEIINQRLLSWERIDAAGMESDQLSLTLDTTGQTGLPKEGARLIWFEGYQNNLKQKGQFIITRITPRLFPPTMTIVATAASFQIEDNTGLKQRRSRSFENMSLASIFNTLIHFHGFTAKVAPEFENIHIAHVDQVNETDLGFLSRLAKEYDGVAKPVDDMYVLASAGQSHTVTGKTITPVVLSVPDHNNPSMAGQFINCQLDKPSRGKVTGVKALWTEVKTGLEHEVSQGIAPFKALPQNYLSKETAMQACQDHLQKVQREGMSVQVSLPGSPYLVAEGLLELDESFPPEMAGIWSIDKVTAKGDSSGGYRCALVATLPA